MRHGRRHRSLSARRTAVAAERPEFTAPERDGSVLISRQPVLDRNLAVAGYRIAYAPAVRTRRSAPDPASLFDTVLNDIGLDGLVGGGVAHLQVPRSVLLALGEPPGDPDRLVLRITRLDAFDPELRPILKTAKERGYTLEIDRLRGPDFDPELLELFTIVEVNVARWMPADIAAIVPELVGRGRTPLAANVRDQEELERARQSGFELFTGAFYGTPSLVAGRKFPIGDLRRVSSIIKLQGDDTTFEEVVEVIEQDVGLAMKLLTYLNSAYIGLPTAVSSIHDAALRLGSRGVARWALTIAIAGAPSLSADLAETALTRARLCEQLAAAVPGLDVGEMFTIGLLSAADIVFGFPLERLIPHLPLNDRVTKALLDGAGPAGEVVRAALAYERGEFDDPALQQIAGDDARAYLAALAWAQETLPPAA
jgi:EAL and modified HD-GYP domain-containing signal transduction protein